MNRYIYHYCAQYQKGLGQIAYIDGIVQLGNRIICHADYQKIKPLIEPESHEKLTIVSLSFIGMEKDS